MVSSVHASSLSQINCNGSKQSAKYPSNSSCCHHVGCNRWRRCPFARSDPWELATKFTATLVLETMDTIAAAAPHDVKKIHAVFDRYDRDGSGNLSMAEVREVMRGLGRTNESELAVMFSEMNGSQRLGQAYVTRDEFTRWWVLRICWPYHDLKADSNVARVAFVCRCTFIIGNPPDFHPSRRYLPLQIYTTALHS